MDFALFRPKNRNRSSYTIPYFLDLQNPFSQFSPLFSAGKSRYDRIANEILMHFRNIKKSAQDVYISDPIDMDKDGNNLTLSDIVADEHNILEDIDTKLKCEKMYSYMSESLSERERLILNLRYGLRGCRPLTQREVAKKLDISRSYVSRIEKKALLSLRKRFEQHP